MKFAENLNEYLDSHDISNYRIYKDTGLSDRILEKRPKAANSGESGHSL